MPRPYPLLLIAAAAPLAGCLERTITVRTEPPGAIVWLNDQEIGRSPVTTAFTFYGKYELRIRKEGYEPLITSRNAVAPWYEYPGIDLVTEAVPARITKKIVWDFALTPSPAPGEQAEAELVERAHSFRDQHIPAEPIQPSPP
jgi:hypothetical protein